VLRRTRVARSELLFLTAPVSLIEPLRHLPRLQLGQILSTVHGRIPVRVPYAPAVRVAGGPDDIAIFALHPAKMPSKRAFNQLRSSLMGTPLAKWCVVTVVNGTEDDA
jgi:hypothetical protein